MPEDYQGWDEDNWVFKEQLTTYINMDHNSHVFTNYQGQNVWSAIYNENCFGDSPTDELCEEQLAFHQIISGMQANVNTQISYNYVDPNDLTADAYDHRYPNVTMWHQRVG